MNQAPAKERLYALDGLRGIAMILVFLNHVNGALLVHALPILGFLGIFSSGVTGVTFLFILSGFLMAYLYPNPVNGFAFLQKRYTRIFPLFLTMCFVMLVLFVNPQMFWVSKLGVVLASAGVSYLIWVYGIKKLQNQKLSSFLFFAFLVLQMCVGLFYAFYIMRSPAIVFQHYHPLVKHSIIGLVNATLTFPLGDYIPMLDGVYWSLTSEILFYILYPWIFVPLVFFLAKKNKFTIAVFMLSLMPLFVGFNMLSYHVFILSALQPALFYYFATGIFLGYVFKNHRQKILALTNTFTGVSGFLPIVIVFASVVGIFLLDILSNNTHTPWLGPWIRVLFAIPLTILVGVILNKNTLFAKLLSLRPFVFLGTISYSLYLSHSLVIHIAESIFSPKNAVENLGVILTALFADIGLAWVLYMLLERPYFLKRVKTVSNNSIAKPVVYMQPQIILAGICALYILGIFVAFQSKYNFFSTIQSHTKSVVTTPIVLKNTSMLSLYAYPQVTMNIHATENNFGIFALSLAHIKTDNQHGEQPTLLFDIREEGSTSSIVTVPYVLDEFKGEPFPFGFPAISNSKNKNYIVSLSLLNGKKDDYVEIDASSMQSVYQPNKKDFLEHPLLFFILLESKIKNIFTNQLAMITFFLLIPFLGMLPLMYSKISLEK